jgi:predicted TPR repeat methyltransferase
VETSKETYERWGRFAELRGNLDKAAQKYRRALLVDPADKSLMEKLKRVETGRQAEDD